MTEVSAPAGPAPQLPPIRTDTSDAGLIAAIEADMVASRIVDFELEAEARLDPDVAWSFGQLPYPYRCFAARARFDAETADDRIREIARPFAERGWALSWWVAPWDTPGDLRGRLERAGLSHEGASPAMAADLDALPLDEARPPGLDIRPVTNQGAIGAYLDVLAEHTLEGANVLERRRRFKATLAAAILRRIPTDPVPIRFLGLVDGQPVATSRVSLSGGVAGLYSVVTAPSLRGRGIGRGMTVAALAAGRTAGYRIGVLQSSELGLPVYRRLGFRQLFEYDVFELQGS